MTVTEKKRKRLTNREWWARYGEQFERTDRHYRELQERWARRDAEREAARKAAEEQDAA
jgi:hypothetical protein